MPPAPFGPDDRPDTIGRYRILARLPSDPQDELYKAFDPLIERAIVVRVFALSASSDERDRIRHAFYDEMRRVGMLAHCGITTLYDAGETPAAFFMATEFVEGGNLAEHLASGLTLDMSDRVSLVTQIADALEYAREQGVLHLDLRPSNVLIGSDHTVKVRGFGVARVQDVIGGADAAALDARADTASLAQLAAEVLGDAISADDERLAAVMTRALSSDASARFETAGDFKYALLLALGMDEAGVRLAWDASREIDTILAADRELLGLPTGPSQGDLDALAEETRLTPGSADAAPAGQGAPDGTHRRS